MIKRRPEASAEDLVWVGAIATAALLAVAFAWVAPELAKLYPAPSGDVFAVWQPLVQPEPTEEVRSILALVAPFALAALVVVLGSARAPRLARGRLVIVAQAIVLVLLIVAVLQQPRRSGFLPLDYFQRYLLSVPVLVAGVLIGIALTAALLLWSGRRPQWTTRVTGALEGRGWIAFVIAALAAVVFLLPGVVSDGTVGQAGAIAAGHVPVQAEDYFSVVNGRTPLVNYIAQYANLLPLLLEPILKTFDSSLLSFSIAVSTLSAIAMLAVYGVFREVTRGPWLALGLFIPFLALALLPWHDMGSHRDYNADYYGVLPGRLVGPLLLAWLCALSFRRRIPIWALFGFVGLVVLNNAEFGIGALIALTVAMAVGSDRSIALRDRARDLAFQGIAGLLGAAVLVCAILLIRSGQLPDLTLLTYFNNVFLRDSFGLVPMHSLGLHWCLYATYAGALLVAAVRYARRDPDRTLTAMLAFSATFGLATAMYFVGRSSQFQLMLLFPCWGFSLALVAWTAAGSLRSARLDRARLRSLLLPGLAALVGFGVMIAAIARVSPPWRQVDGLIDGGPDVYAELPAQAYVEANSASGDHILLIGTTLDHRVADRAGVVNVSPINGVTGLITKDQADRALDQLDDEGGDLVFERIVRKPPGGGLAFAIPEFAGILRQRGYRLAGQDPASGLRIWRRAAS